MTKETPFHQEAINAIVTLGLRIQKETIQNLLVDARQVEVPDKVIEGKHAVVLMLADKLDKIEKELGKL